VFESVQIYALRTDEHEIVVQICCRARRDLECFVTTRCYLAVSPWIRGDGGGHTYDDGVGRDDRGNDIYTTPCVNGQVTPSILNSLALARTTLYKHCMCSEFSVSSFVFARRNLGRYSAL
jgi:hypothetical protein